MADSTDNTVETREKNTFPYPSEAYSDAINSPVYRLSELMFGSLLAAYVLGFLSFASATADSTNDIIRNWGQFNQTVELILVRAPYLFISITFAYITAGAYVTYHGGILTMPFMQLEKLSIDFRLALSQAVFFGLSMLYPMLFPSWLGITLLISAYRQYQGYKQVTKFFYEKLPHKPEVKGNMAVREEDDRDALNNFRNKFRVIIKKYVMFSSWQRTPKAVLVTGIILIITPPAIWLILLNATGQESESDILYKNRVVFWVSFTIFIIIAWYVHKVIGQRASFLYKKTQTEPKMTQKTQTESKITSEIDEKLNRIISELIQKTQTEPKIAPRIDERFDALVEELKGIVLEYENEQNK